MTLHFDPRTKLICLILVVINTMFFHPNGMGEHMDDFYLSIWNHKGKWEKVNTVGNVLIVLRIWAGIFPA